MPVTYTYVGITSITPDNGPAIGGQSVTIIGSGFNLATGVLFEALHATHFVIVSDTEITCTTPAHHTGLVSVTVSGIDTLSDAYTYELASELMLPPIPFRVPVLQQGGLIEVSSWGRWLSTVKQRIEAPITIAPEQVVGADLTRVNDTNVTLTLNGTPTGSLLSAVELQLGWQGILSTTRGGTGVGTVYTQGSVLFADASGRIAQDNANFFWDDTNFRLGIGTATPSARLHLPAGTTAASSAPLKLTSGSLLTTAEVGAIEFLTDGFYATITTGAARKGIILDDGTTLTSGRVPYATTNGRLTDSANLKWDNGNSILDIGSPSAAISARLRVLGISSNCIEVQSSGATADIIYSPTGGDRWLCGAGQIAVDDFGMGNATRGTFPLTITGGASGGQVKIPISLLIGTGGNLTSAGDGQLVFTNNAVNKRVQFQTFADGYLRVLLFDGSNFATFEAGAITAQGVFHAVSTTTLDDVATMAAAGAYAFSGRTRIKSPSNGVLTLFDQAETSFARLQLGGTTSSYPSMKRNAAAINFRLADDSADAAITASSGTFSTLTSGRVTFASTGGLLVDDADLTFATDTLTTTKLAVTSTITSYKAIATTAWGVPAIYGYGRSEAQTAAVASVATYTVGAADGSFRVSCNVNVTTSTTHNFTVAVDYTDETNTAQTLTMPVSQLSGTILTAITNVTGAGPYEGVPLQIRCKASTVITIKTTGTFTTVTYNVEGSIIQVS